MSKPAKSLLRTRLFPLLFILAVLPVAAMGGLFYALALDSVESVLGQQSLAVARRAALRCTALFARLDLESRLPTRSREVRLFYRAQGDAAQVQEIVERDLEPYLRWLLDAVESPYAQVIFLDAGGTPLFKFAADQITLPQPGQTAAVAFEPTDRAGRPNAEERWRITLQQTRDYGAVVRLARPVQDAGAATQPPGYVLLDLPLQELLPEHSSADVDLLLLERDNEQVLYGPEGVERGKALAEVLPDLARAFDVAAQDSSGTVTFAHQEEEHLAAYVDMQDPAWTFAALVATDPYTAAPRRTGLLTLAATTLFILLSGTLVFLLVRRVQERSTRLEEANLRLEEQNVLIQEATRRKSAFLASMSHDLRTPMNAIIGYTRILVRRNKDVLEARQYRNLENIQISANNLLNLINEILDLSKIESGRIDINPTQVDLKQLVDECAASVESLVAPGVELQRHLDDTNAIYTDGECLRKVVMNLLSNAMKFTEQGSIVLSLKSVDGGAKIAVADTGVGIPAADLPHIFDEFQQVERQGSAEKEGTGLGLAIAKKSLELLGGSMSAESKVGMGTTFTLQIGDYST